MYRALGETVRGKNPGPAHYGLALLEKSARLLGVITQNIDGLHAAAGSRQVIEIHGDCRTLHCLRCGQLERAERDFSEEESVPRCCSCGFPLKPNVVLFEESVRSMDEVEELLGSCDLLLVVGTSSTVYPAAGFPRQVLGRGGGIFEFNLEKTSLSPFCHFFFEGRVDDTIPEFVSAVLRLRSE